MNESLVAGLLNLLINFQVTGTGLFSSGVNKNFSVLLIILHLMP